MNEKVMVSPEIQTEAVVLPQIVSIKQASQRMGLPEYYIRRLCREVPGYDRLSLHPATRFIATMNYGYAEIGRAHV